MEWIELLKGAYNFSPPVILFILLVAYQRGDFISKREHEEARKDRDLARQEAKEWREAALEALQQNSQLIPASRVSVEVAKALPAALGAHGEASEKK